MVFVLKMKFKQTFSCVVHEMSVLRMRIKRAFLLFLSAWGFAREKSDASFALEFLFGFVLTIVILKAFSNLVRCLFVLLL